MACLFLLNSRIMSAVFFHYTFLYSHHWVFHKETHIFRSVVQYPSQVKCFILYYYLANQFKTLKILNLFIVGPYLWNEVKHLFHYWLVFEVEGKVETGEKHIFFFELSSMLFLSFLIKNCWTFSPCSENFKNIYKHGITVL